MSHRSHVTPSQRVAFRATSSNTKCWAHEPCLAEPWVVWHRSTSHVTQINESCHTGVTSHRRRGWLSGLHRRTQNAEHMSHVSQSHELCDTDRRVMSHRSTSHVSQINESCHTKVTWHHSRGWLSELHRSTWNAHEPCLTDHWVMVRRWASHVTQINVSCHTDQCVISHRSMCHVTQINVSRHTVSKGGFQGNVVLNIRFKGNVVFNIGFKGNIVESEMLCAIKYWHLKICVAVCCSVLQCVAVRCQVLQCGAVCCSRAVGCSVVQCVAVCGSVLQKILAVGIVLEWERERGNKQEKYRRSQRLFFVGMYCTCAFRKGCLVRARLSECHSLCRK